MIKAATGFLQELPEDVVHEAAEEGAGDSDSDVEDKKAKRGTKAASKKGGGLLKGRKKASPAAVVLKAHPPVSEDGAVISNPDVKDEGAPRKHRKATKTTHEKGEGHRKGRGKESLATIIKNTPPSRTAASSSLADLSAVAAFATTASPIHPSVVGPMISGMESETSKNPSELDMGNAYVPPMRSPVSAIMYNQCRGQCTNYVSQGIKFMENDLKSDLVSNLRVYYCQGNVAQSCAQVHTNVDEPRPHSGEASMPVGDNEEPNVPTSPLNGSSGVKAKPYKRLLHANIENGSGLLGGFDDEDDEFDIAPSHQGNDWYRNISVPPSSNPSSTRPSSPQTEPSDFDLHDAVGSDQGDVTTGITVRGERKHEQKSLKRRECFSSS